MGVIKKILKIRTTTPLWATYLQESTPAHHRDTYTSMFTVALFTRAKIWDQSTGPSTEE